MQQGLDQDDPIFIKRFVREAKLTHSFNQPNIVKVFDAGSDFQTGCLYLAMEYVEGKTLNELSCDRQLSEAELLEVLDSMAQALQTLADAKVVHRDIKPSNIMLTVDGVYKLMDLGIAKAESNTHAGEMTLTMDQTCIGTPGYASPEQCRAAHNVDIRSDIYSLGVTIYHVASGVMPFDGDTPVAIIIKVLQSEAEPLEKYRSDLSPQFISLIRRMMMKKAEDRPNSIEELRQLIRDVSRGKNFSSPKEKAISAGKEILAVTGKVLRTTGTLLRTGVQHLRQTQQFSPQEQKSFSAEKKPSFIWKVLTFLFKFAVGIVLAVVAGLHLIYVWMWYTNDQGEYISYAAFMRKVPEFTGAKRLLREKTIVVVPTSSWFRGATQYWAIL